MLDIVLWISSVIITLLKKLSGVNITVSGEALPDAPVLFLANHFTRFETFVVPYLLFHEHKRTGRSLADDTVFVGWLGEYMRLAGSISNKNRARDAIIINDFLSGAADWIIYPEGHMVKNKRITFDNGEFCIHTVVREGPVYTGAAALALKAEIYRMRIRKLKDSARRKEFSHKHHIAEQKVREAISLKIVPLSITYHPIRPGVNRLLLWLDRHFNLRGTRLFEELEIEINLLMDANMHLHFGKAIPVVQYIETYMRQHPGSLEDEAYTGKLINAKRHKIINDVMAQVYGNMQINFDHIFILSLVTMPTYKVCPSYLKTLIYKNARELRHNKALNLHPLLKKELFRLILDKKYAPFVSAIALAQTQKILYQDSEGDYLFDKNLLEKAYDFNQIRVKNTFQVILNEIKWQRAITDAAKQNATFTEQELREENFAHLQKRDRDYFEQEYLTYHKTPPGKGAVGAPRVWYDAKNRTGLVFCHGYMASPAEAWEMAEYLFDKGINVYLPRLRGHGTDPRALLKADSREWEVDFERAFTAMRQVCDTLFIGGFSTGGLLALIHAARYEADGVIAVNSALRLNNLQVSYVVPPLHAFNEMISHLHARGIREWIDNRHTENPDINYTRHPLASIAQMEKIMTHADKVLEKIATPVLIIQGDKDPVVNPKSARLIYDRIPAQTKKLVLLPREKHIILTSEGKEEIFQTIYRFIGDIVQKS